jgi:hypothetical protein
MWNATSVTCACKQSKVKTFDSEFSSMNLILTRYVDEGNKLIYKYIAASLKRGYKIGFNETIASVVRSTES